MTSPMPQRTSPATSTQREMALVFHALHTDGVLVLPNSWDVASARLIEDAGARAIATTSAGVSWSLGHPDGERLSRERAVDLIARTVAAVDVPVTADIETGYGTNLDELAVTVRAVLDAGAVGVNVEDSTGAALRAMEEQAERIAVVRSTAEATGVPLFINARTDTYLIGVGEPAHRMTETLRRAQTYAAAGADGVFVPGVLDPGIVRELARDVPAPLNVMAGPGAPSVAELAETGARRVSVGPAIAQAVYALTRRAALELINHGTYGTLQHGLGYATLNAALARR